ncbi:peptidoglycan DD-metalloendopeptidase family protein [Paenibacillus sp. GCM10027626]|uniref:peptidoglycan DD-metalloendopeptidase family protein n=1 Tax=Paenibacillus sp. GCM10027626 TaxID=3273411 RepID=UPI00363E2BB5
MTERKDRFRKVWASFQQTFRINRSHHKRKKLLLFTGGVLVLIVAAGIGGNYYVKSNMVDYYTVFRDGQLIGDIASAELVKQRIEQEEQQLKEANPHLNMVLDTGNLTYESKRTYKAVPDSEGTLNKLGTLFTSHAEGVELKVDGKTVGIVRDQATADAILSRVKTRFSPKESAGKVKKPEVTALAYKENDSGKGNTVEQTKSELKSVAIKEKIATAAVDVQPEKITDPEKMYLKLVKGSEKPTKYTVQKGDCVGCIAQKFNISPQVIYENNKWIKDDMIRDGDELDLTVRQPEVTVETVEHVTEIETIEPMTVYRENSNMREGETKLLRVGKEGKKKLVYKLVKRNGYLVKEELLGEQVLEVTISTIIMKGTKVSGEGTGTFAWPVSGADLTSSFGQRWGRLHKGIDMVGDETIMAADDGVVEFAGTKNGYGNCVIIDHKNGYKTLYGHMSKISVKAGETVEKGDALGIMGNTGHSFGTHLHFEIHKDGEVQNPIKYL